MRRGTLRKRSGERTVVLESFFLDTAGLATALVLIPFLILYLIRPKPHNEKIPSLLFIMRETGKTNINSFFRSFLKDLLFLFHLLILLFLILAAAQPFINVPQDILADQTVILIDTSASMQADGRFDKAVAIAKQHLGRENTIIAIQGMPAVLTERASPASAKTVLDLLKPVDTGTDIADALQAAATYAGSGSRVVVISDFIATAGDLDYDTSADILEAQGAEVSYIPLTTGQDNIGIIDLLVGPVTSSLWVKNYDARPAEVKLKISDATQTVLLGPGESKEVTFNTPAGVAEIAINGSDDLSVDDKVWTSTPEKNTIKLLTITNDKNAVERSNVRLAMDVISQNFPTSFEITWAEPPKIPKLEHDLYFVKDANLDFILPGYLKDLKQQVEGGASLVIFPQANLFSIDWQGLLPIAPVEDSQGTRNEITGELSTLTKDIEFGQINAYTRVAAIPGSVVVATAGADPLIVSKRLGKGTVLYYGIDDDQASFSRNPTYPIFWRRVFDRLTNRPSLENLNVRTGGRLAFAADTTVKTPDGAITGNVIPLDKVGLYTYRDTTVAANLLNDAESAIASSGNVTKARLDTGDRKAQKVPFELTTWLLWAVLGLLLLELFYVKYRGDF